MSFTCTITLSYLWRGSLAEQKCWAKNSPLVRSEVWSSLALPLLLMCTSGQQSQSHTQSGLSRLRYLWFHKESGAEKWPPSLADIGCGADNGADACGGSSDTSWGIRCGFGCQLPSRWVRLCWMCDKRCQKPWGSRAGTDGGLDFQCVKVFDESKLTLHLKNKGKYDIAYK